MCAALFGFTLVCSTMTFSAPSVVVIGDPATSDSRIAARSRKTLTYPAPATLRRLIPAGSRPGSCSQPTIAVARSRGARFSPVAAFIRFARSKATGHARSACARSRGTSITGSSTRSPDVASVAAAICDLRALVRESSIGRKSPGPADPACENAESTTRTPPRARLPIRPLASSPPLALLYMETPLHKDPRAVASWSADSARMRFATLRVAFLTPVGPDTYHRRFRLGGHKPP